MLRFILVILAKMVNTSKDNRGSISLVQIAHHNRLSIARKSAVKTQEMDVRNGKNFRRMLNPESAVN